MVDASNSNDKTGTGERTKHTDSPAPAEKSRRKKVLVNTLERIAMPRKSAAAPMQDKAAPPADTPNPHRLGPLDEDSKPTRTATIPETLNRYYRIIGDTTKGRYFFPGEGDVEAFRDQGRKMVTKQDSPKVAQSMVDLAEAKGWANLHVSGSDQFRRTVWMAAQEHGMAVEGYTPTTQDLENARAKNNTIESDTAPTPATESARAPTSDAVIDAGDRSNSLPAPGDTSARTQAAPTAGDARARVIEPTTEQARDYQASVAGATEKRIQKQTAIKEKLNSSPTDSTPETPLRTAYLKFKKADALAAHPRLKPVYAFERAAEDFVNLNSTRFNTATGPMFVDSVREQALEVLAQGKALPDRPNLSALPKTPPAPKQRGAELEL